MRVQLLIGLLTIVILTIFGVVYAVDQSRQVHQETATGAVIGRVINAEGEFVSNAEVGFINANSATGRKFMTYTDEQGVFSIDLIPGKYSMSAAKEEDGYAPTDDDFYSNGLAQDPQVVVYEQQTTSDVVAHLGPKAARLVGHVTDATTNNRIIDAQITLRRLDNPVYEVSRSSDLDGAFLILAPAMPFTVEVSAPGYKKWLYKEAGSTNQADAPYLTPAGTKKMTISLYRTK